MSSVVEGITYRVTWVAQPGACRRCLNLHGREWTLNTLEEATMLKDTVSHSHCRCELDVEIEVDLEKLQIG